MGSGRASLTNSYHFNVLPTLSRQLDCQPRSSPRTATRRQRQSRAGARFPFCTAECWPWPAGLVASLSEPAGRVSTRPAGRGRSEGTGVAGGAAGGASLVTCLSPQESDSPAGARPGQSPSIGGAHQNEQQRTRPWTPASAGATDQRYTPPQAPSSGLLIVRGNRRGPRYPQHVRYGMFHRDETSCSNPVVFCIRNLD